MKVIMSFFIIFGLMSLLNSREVFADQTLQSRIDSTMEGGTLYLKKGVYHEPIVLDKPIVLVGEKGATFQSCSTKPMITVTGQDVSLIGIAIVSCPKDESPAAILVSGQNHLLEDLTIVTPIRGIQFDNTKKSMVRNITISGQGSENGVDLWQSNSNRFERIQMKHVEDGFYMENSHHNTFIENTVQNSRYGFHIMFSNYITIRDNISRKNFTGAMIMGTKGSLIEANKLTDNNQNVNAQGLLLYDIHESAIRKNSISTNRVGMYMEDSNNNEIVSNNFTANFVGAQITKIENNRITNNSFSSNVNEIQAKEETHNIIENNYWDAALKLDTDGDRLSNLPYRADPYFLNLSKDVPAYQLFFQHPGMLLLQKMLKSPESVLVEDNSPLMKNNIHFDIKQETSRSIAWMISMFMIISILLFIYLGRKKI
jgi:nitrous oxidase accessory protein